MSQDDENFKQANLGLQQIKQDSAERVLAAAQINATLSVANQVFYLREELARITDAIEALQGSAASSERIAGAAEVLSTHVEAIRYDLQTRNQ